MADIKDLHNISQELQCIREDYNTVPDKCASAKIVFFHPLMMQCRKNPKIPNNRPLSM